MTAFLDPTVADLQARVAALEQALARVGSPETLSPNYLTVDPTGHVGADFTGHVHAQGLDLNATRLGSPPDDRRIRFNDQDVGLPAADIYAFDSLNSGLRELFVRALRGLGIPAPSGEGSFVQLYAGTDPDDGTSAKVTAQSPQPRVSVGAGGDAVTLLTSSGDSGFVQDAQRKGRTGTILLDAGVLSVVWSGASTVSGATVVNLVNASMTPRAIDVSCRVRSDGGTAFAIYSGVGTGVFTVQAVASAAPAANVNCNVSWIAIG